jgi:serine/threonine protein kinase
MSAFSPPLRPLSWPSGTVFGMTGWNFREGAEIAEGVRAVRLLGGGLRYEAYLAWHDHLRALVVVKVLRPDLVDDEVTRAGLRGEARALDELAHPMLLRSFGARLDHARPHVILEFIEGPRLSTLIRRYGVSIEQLLPLALNLCSALHYLAHAGYVHLDVKPRNVIMGHEPRLIDLSIARRMEDLAALSSPVGTDAYMAPEQCDPARFGTIGPPADVWGLGATLYEALTGRRPFDGTGSERFPQLRRPPRPLPDDVPAPLARLVLDCMASEPEQRPAAGDLGDRLEPLVDALPAPRLGRFRPAPKRSRRRRSIHRRAPAGRLRAPRCAFSTGPWAARRPAASRRRAGAGARRARTRSRWRSGASRGAAGPRR